MAISKTTKASLLAGNRGVPETIDIWWEEDFKPEMPEVSGMLALAQRLLRRITTPKGFFPWWPNEGINIHEYILTKVPTWRIKSDVESECLRDEQVETIIATPEYRDGGKSIYLELFVVSKVGNFNFTMTATEASASLIALQAIGT